MSVSARLAPSFLPATAVLELTYRCNHRCLFCSCPWENPAGDFDKRPELGTAEWKRAIAKVTGMGVVNLAFSGGEALMRGDCLELLAYSASRRVEHIETENGELRSSWGPPNLYLLSNGVKVDDRVLAFCRDRKVQLSLSLPGLSTFAELTGGGSADRVLSLFQTAKKMGLKTVANITVTRRNLPELRETLAAALLAGATQVLLNRFLPGGRGLQHAAELGLDRNQLADMLRVAEEVLSTAGAFGFLGAEVPKCCVPDQPFKRLTVSTGCSAALQFFVIDPSGYLRVCNHSPVRLESIAEIEKVKLNPYWMRFTQKRYLPDGCLECSQSKGCDGGCREAAHLSGGAIDAMDPLLV